MKLFYTLGGGLGHLTRIKRFITSHHITDNYIVFSTKWATKVFPKERCLIIPQKVIDNKMLLFDFLIFQLKKNKIEELYIDTFPFGLFKEIDPLEIPFKCQLFYIARYIHWQRYIDNYQFTSFQFKATFIVDFLHKKQSDFIKENSLAIHRLRIDEKSITPQQTPPKYYLINHSGNEEEIYQLLKLLENDERYQKEKLPIVINTTQPLHNLERKDIKVIHKYPAFHLFEEAKLIITACGYNSMIETLAFRNKHLFLPFKRRFDNQFERARRRDELS